MDYQQLRFNYERHPDQDRAEPARHAVIIVGAGPVGMSLAIDIAQQGVPVVLLESKTRLSLGSRALCFSKRTLEVFDRLGVGQRMVDKGVAWNIGKVFFRDALLYRFDLLPESGHARPAFINLQQYYIEGYLAERIAALPQIDLRWANKVIAVTPQSDRTRLTVETPEGHYQLDADWVAACDGSRSSVRGLIGQEARGRVFRDRFLIVDIRLQADRPAERCFWFDPPFHRHQSALLHVQPDGIWRVDFQLGWDADPEVERQPRNIRPRINALLGDGTEYEIVWASVYTFSCVRMDRFRQGRMIFLGDAAHGVSPFGARGANSGIQDADNLAWKLAAVVKGRAPERLIDSYVSEREAAADENLRHACRSTDFITPKSPISLLFRDATLELARCYPFARSLVNSGRLSQPTPLRDSPLNTPDSGRIDSDRIDSDRIDSDRIDGDRIDSDRVDSDGFASMLMLGSPAADAPVARTDGSRCWLLPQLGTDFTVLMAVDAGDGGQALQLTRLREEGEAIAPLRVVRIVLQGCLPSPTDEPLLAQSQSEVLIDVEGRIAQRYDLKPGTVVLLRPDQHLCARWRAPRPGQLAAALATALARTVTAG